MCDRLQTGYDDLISLRYEWIRHLQTMCSVTKVSIRPERDMHAHNCEHVPLSYVLEGCIYLYVRLSDCCIEWMHLNHNVFYSDVETGPSDASPLTPVKQIPVARFQTPYTERLQTPLMSPALKEWLVSPAATGTYKRTEVRLSWHMDKVNVLERCISQCILAIVLEGCVSQGRGLV